MNILGPSKSRPEVAAAWAGSRGCTNTFKNLADLYWRYAPERGVRPEVAYCQSGKETAFGNFGGVLTAQWRNPCGLKVSGGGANDDPEAHQVFPTWDAGVIAHLDHLALYAGALGYPRLDTPDPRHFDSLFGKSPTVEGLSGNWAGEGYGESLRDGFVATLLAFAYTPPFAPVYVLASELQLTVDNLIAGTVRGDELLEQQLDDLRKQLLELTLTIKDAAERLLS